MKFVVSSTDLLSHLTAISKVISNKSTLPILDNFLFTVSDDGLSITASDSESTLITRLELDNVEGEGIIALPAKLLIETLREFPEQPLTFQMDLSTFGVQIFSENDIYNLQNNLLNNVINGIKLYGSFKIK